MVYAKIIKNGEVAALIAYGYTPKIGEGSGVQIISAEEYSEIAASIGPVLPQEQPESGQISDKEALAIITGEEE